MAEEEEIVETDPYCTSDRFEAKMASKPLKLEKITLSASCQSMKLASMVLAFPWVVATLPWVTFSFGVASHYIKNNMVTMNSQIDFIASAKLEIP